MDFKGFYESKGFQVGDCWKTCGGGHCCTFYKHYGKMRFADKKAQHLYLFDFEYDYLDKNDLLDEKFRETARKHSYPYRGHQLQFYMVKCGYGGLCPRHEFRPLSCFLYPYMPYFDANGKVEKLYNHSIYDDVYEAIELDKPCTLYDKFTADNYQKLADQYFNDKRFYFYTNLFVKFKEKAVESFKSISKAENFEDSLMDLEALFLTNRFVTPEEALQLVDHENQKFKVFPA